VEAVAACLGAGRTAIVLVPEAEPLADTANQVLERFGPNACAYLGGSPRLRYRRWLEIAAGSYEVVVGTRPAVFAPLRRPGLIWISREVHPGHREDRSPYYHVREVASARARLDQGTCVLSSLSPSAETAAGIASKRIGVRRPPRDVERAAAPLVESTPPEAEDRSQRLGRLLKDVRSAALIVSRGGYGVARVCRSCNRPAACATCNGPIVSEAGRTRCRVCDAPGVCANCGGRSFGVERGGAERIAEWAARLAPTPVTMDTADHPAAPGADRILVGTAASVNDVGAPGLDLVAILDPDRALARPGVHAGEQAVATWMEAAAWARSKSRGGRVLIQTRHPGHPTIQSLVRWDPMPFLRWELEHRTEAGFPAGHPVFRVAGDASLRDALRTLSPTTLLATEGPGEPATICLVVVAPGALQGFRETVLRLARAGVVSRVEAEPQL
jgi:primosomal protein N' (replication factor Y)